MHESTPADTLNLNGVLRRAMELLEEDFRPLAIEIAARLEDGLPDIHGDYNRTLQVAVNLLSNARDALIDPAATRPRRLEISTFSSRDEVGMAVEDSGPGIPSGERARVFEAYYSTKGIHRAIGLGLAVCREIVSSQGGTLAVEDGALGGARFIACFPVGDLSDAATSTPRILFIGGDLEALHVLAGHLPDRGATARIAESELAAIALLRSDTFDLVIADYFLSGMTSCALLEVMTPFFGPRCPPAIIIHDRRLEEIEAGGHCLLERPVTGGSLRRAIRQVLR